MDPHKRHLKKLKRLQNLRKEKLKEKGAKKKVKKNRDDLEDPKNDENRSLNGKVSDVGQFYNTNQIEFVSLQIYVIYRLPLFVCLELF